MERLNASERESSTTSGPPHAELEWSEQQNWLMDKPKEIGLIEQPTHERFIWLLFAKVEM